MGTIASVRTAVIETPIVTDIKTTYGSWTRQPHVIVKLTTDSGLDGLGEASPLGFFTGETADIVRTAIDRTLGTVLLGRDPFDLESILWSLDAALPHNNTAKAALDMALHDLIGKSLGVPLYRVLGGKFRARVPSAVAVGINDLKEMRREALDWVAKGYRTLKLKIGLDPAKDEKNVQAVREAVGPEVRLRVDANQGYAATTAIEVGRRIAPYGIEYLEQPVAAWDLKGLAEVRQATGLRVAADESLYTAQDALRLIEARAVDVFVIKMIKVGGLRRATRIAHLAQAAGLQCVTVSPLETALGTAAGAHWAAALANGEPDHELVGPLYLQEDPFVGVTIEGNSIAPPEEPGLGVRLQREIF
jgi:o-succinylbenzoate synthase